MKIFSARLGAGLLSAWLWRKIVNFSSCCCCLLIELGLPHFLHLSIIWWSHGTIFRIQSKSGKFVPLWAPFCSWLALVRPRPEEIKDDNQARQKDEVILQLHSHQLLSVHLLSFPGWQRHISPEKQECQDETKLPRINLCMGHMLSPGVILRIPPIKLFPGEWPFNELPELKKKSLKIISWG